VLDAQPISGRPMSECLKWLEQLGSALSRGSFSCESADDACAGYICLGCLQNAAEPFQPDRLSTPSSEEVANKLAIDLFEMRRLMTLLLRQNARKRLERKSPTSIKLSVQSCDHKSLTFEVRRSMWRGSNR